MLINVWLNKSTLFASKIAWIMRLFNDEWVTPFIDFYDESKICLSTFDFDNSNEFTFYDNDNVVFVHFNNLRNINSLPYIYLNFSS